MKKVMLQVTQHREVLELLSKELEVHRSGGLVNRVGPWRSPLQQSLLLSRPRNGRHRLGVSAGT